MLLATVMRFFTSSFRHAGLGALLISAAVAADATEKSVRQDGPSVAVVHTSAWSQGDPAREGAAEMMVLLEVARLRQNSSKGGLVAVGDRRGLFTAGAEEALRHAVLQGMPVVKLASHGRVLPAPHGLFLDGGTLSEDEATQVLARCLDIYGSFPISVAAQNGALPGKLRDHLQRFQKEFNLAAATRVAAR